MPGIDDGARDERTALEYAERMVAAGINEATVTPHIGAPYFDVSVHEVAERTASLQRSLDREKIDLHLLPGGELHPEGAASMTRSELELVAQGPAGRRWVLAEVPFAGVDSDFVDLVRSIGRRGFGAVIAHPERARGISAPGGMRHVLALLREGAVLQVNAASLRGDHGSEAREVGRRLIRSRSAYLIASDGHPGTRDQLVTDAVDSAVELGASRLQTEQLLASNPRLLLRDGLLPVGHSQWEPGESLLEEFGLVRAGHSA